jgi:hypothetical protein
MTQRNTNKEEGIREALLGYLWILKEIVIHPTLVLARHFCEGPKVWHDISLRFVRRWHYMRPQSGYSDGGELATTRAAVIYPLSNTEVGFA